MPNKTKFQSNHQPTTISKIKDSILILLITIISPHLLSIFHFPITKFHYIFLTLISISSILYIFTQQSDTNNPIQEVFETNNIHINNQYPILLKLKQKGNKNND